MKEIYLLFICLCFSFHTLAQKLSVSDAFENGNIEKVSIDNDRHYLKVRSSLKNGDTKRIWLYGHIEGIKEGKLLTIEILYESKSFLMPYIVYSYDNQHWQTLEETENTGNSRIFEHKFDKDKVYIATSYPYTYTMLRHFIGNHFYQSPESHFSYIGYSEQGRPVPYLAIVPNRQTTPKGVIWILGRQHTMEAPASHFTEGVMQFLISNSDTASRFRKQFELHVVPMVDVDQVVAGGNGKDQKPVDFNRSWQGNTHWQAIQAIKSRMFETASEAPLVGLFDLHSPYPLNNGSHYYDRCYGDSACKADIRTLYKMYKDLGGPQGMWANISGPSPARGSSWLAARPDIKGADEMPLFPSIKVQTTNEQAWHDKNQKPYTPDMLRYFGRQYGKAMALYYLQADF